MGTQTLQPSFTGAWTLAERQHGVVTRMQLLDLGFSPQAIKHRLSTGRLHPVARGIYALGRPQLNRHGEWMAAVLSCGREAVLSHESAAALWDIRSEMVRTIEVSVPLGAGPRRPGVVVHRRAALIADDFTRHHGIPVTTPFCTLVDLAVRLPRGGLEAAIKEADAQGLANPETVRSALDGLSGRPGVAVLREILDRATFALTDSELERRFLPLARSAGLPTPETGCRVNGFEVDFHWPKLGLVVEVDGLRYHRTPGQQVRDRVRDQAHTCAGLTPLRFTHAQVRYQAGYVRATLAAVARRLSTTQPAR